MAKGSLFAGSPFLITVLREDISCLFLLAEDRSGSILLHEDTNHVEKNLCRSLARAKNYSSSANSTCFFFFKEVIAAETDSEVDVRECQAVERCSKRI